jgi:transcriptional regulator with XRE-family HTH domain
MNLNDLDKKLQENPEYVEAMNELKLHFELANAVLRARLKKGWSQTELARVVGTKQANISRIEAGLGNPTLALIRKLSRVLGMEVRIEVSGFQPPQPKFTTTTSHEASDSVIQVDNWPVYHSEPQYRQISDASADEEGYQV